MATSSVSSETLAAFPRQRQWLLPALRALQEAHGYLSADALSEVAAHLRVPASEVWGVATHYPEFRIRPRGRHHVRVCTGVSCALLGGREILSALVQRLRVVPGEWGPETPISVEAADCFFACPIAPAIEVDGRLRGRIRPEDVARVEGWCSEPSRHAQDAAVSPPPRTAPVARSAPQHLDGLVAAAGGRQQRRPLLRLLVGMGTGPRAVGAEATHAALRAEVERRRLSAAVIEGACNGACYAAPTVEVQREGWPRALFEQVTAEHAAALVDFVGREDATANANLRGVVWADRSWRGLTAAAEHPFWRGQTRALLERVGSIDPESLDEALLAGAYRALAQALDRPPTDVIERVKAAGLQGRGGAFFPAALKWEACRKAAGEPKYLVLNGEEGEPGIFKDRHLMEGDPHLLLEGVLLAAYAAGATRAILYVHGEADRSAARLALAVAETRAAGLVGPRVLGRDVECEIELRRGAGGFVLGEETALLESIEGRRAQPRTRPPFPTDAGLWGQPTVINNVETLAAVPLIVGRGAAWFTALGTDRAPGTKIFGLSGPLARPGVVEVRGGVTLRTLLDEIGGGARDGQPLRGALVGGPSGTIVPAALFDVPMEPRGEVSPGTGGIVAIDQQASIVEILKILLDFNARESCGKCTPCREGLPRLLGMLDELGSSPEGEARARELAETIQLASLCGLGQAAPLGLLRGLEAFGAELGTTRR